ncbi:MAG: glycosyltransferase family 92 protein, partial [Methyloligellaceae bacterium]
MNDMEIVRLGDRRFFLFLDIFVHWGGRKITAVAPYYGDDIDWPEHGVDLQDVVLRFGTHQVKGRYVPHRLDSWEPCVLFDFEDSVLEDYLRDHPSIAFEIRAGSFSKEFVLGTAPAPGHDVSMSLIVRDCNRWLPYFLNYYLDCLECDHVYLYDNKTHDADGLQHIVRSYADRGQLSYIPWHYRWRNEADGKQIGQIPQQAHSLNKFGQCRWIGFFDYDEFLRIPGRTLKEFLKDYDPSEVDGLSFGLRWFKYVGDEALEDISNPLLSFFDAKPDSLGRKRQKLVVSPRDVRFLRIHWLEDGKNEVPVDDTDIYFHHYYLNPDRFEKGKTESPGVRDDYMLGFAEQLIRSDRGRSNIADNGKRDATRAGGNPKPRNAEQLIAHVMDAFDIAETENSKLSEDVMALPGMCGRRNRHFLNALCAFENCRYLEIGSHKGASLSAAMYGNEISAVAIDDWSQFDGSREAVIAATSDLTCGSELRLIEQDCFTVDPAELGPFDVYYYDGDHSAESQARALERFYDCLDDRAVVVIDDWNWETVRQGTRRAMAKLDIPIIFEKEIFLPEADTAGMPRHRGRDTWWNGIYVMIVDKQAAPLSKSSRRRAVTGSPIGAQKQRQPIAVVIFSKDRACQLEALLRSMSRFLEHPHETTVLYTASDQSYQTGYDALSGSYPSLNWVRETDFKADLIRLIREAGERGARHVMFLVDDIV